MTPSTWWAMDGKHLPHLSKIAQCVFSQPVSASAAERNWSIYSNIKSKTRNCLGPEVADKLICAHKALHLTSKLQSAEYREAAAAWDNGKIDPDKNDANKVDDFAKFAA
eukprot:6180919-Pleurochrysis_carterae.AAC.1